MIKDDMMKGAFRTKHFQSGQFASKFSLSLVVLCTLYSSTALAMMKLNVKCPKKFVGTVTKVANSEAPFFSQSSINQLKKVDVYFKNEETVRGNVDNTVMIQTLKNGPTKFQEGNQYEVEMRANYICSVKRLGQIEPEGF